MKPLQGKVAVITGCSSGIGLATANVVSPGPMATPIYGKLSLPKEAVDAFARAWCPRIL